MKVSMAAMKREGDNTNHIQGFASFVNEEVNPQKNPRGWKDELDSRMESLAMDYAMKHKGEVEFDDDGAKLNIYFNFTGNRFAKPLKEIMA